MSRMKAIPHIQSDIRNHAIINAIQGRFPNKINTIRGFHKLRKQARGRGGAGGIQMLMLQHDLM